MRYVLSAVALLFTPLLFGQNALGGMLTISSLQGNNALGLYLAQEVGNYPPDSVEVEAYHLESGGYVSAGTYTLLREFSWTYDNTQLSTYISPYITLDTGKYRFTHLLSITPWANSTLTQAIISLDYSNPGSHSSTYLQGPLPTAFYAGDSTIVQPWTGISGMIGENDNDLLQFSHGTPHALCLSGTFSTANSFTAPQLSFSNNALLINSNEPGRYGSMITIEEYSFGVLRSINRMIWSFDISADAVFIPELTPEIQGDIAHIFDLRGRQMGKEISTLSSGVYWVEFTSGRKEYRAVL